MSRNKKPRKAHTPKYIAKNVMKTFFGGMSKSHGDELVLLNIKNHASLAALAQGTATRDDWDRLVGAINMANVMCDQGIGSELRSRTVPARDALCEIGKRAIMINKFICKGDELKVLNEAMECHDAQLENIRAIDIDRAADEVIRRIRFRENTTNVVSEVEKDMRIAELASVRRADDRIAA